MTNFLTKRKIFNFCSIIILLFALLFRLHYYCLNNPFWGDESNLVMPLIFHSWKNILFSYDELGELAPPLFFFAEKIITDVFGISEYSVRIIPLISSFISCIMFLLFVNKIFDNNRAKLLSLFLFAISTPLIIMAGFYKPYSTEVAVALIILYFFGLNFSFKNKSISVCFLVILTHVLCFLTSFQSVFIIFSCLLVHFMYACLFEKNKYLIFKIFGVTLIDLLCLGIYYYFFLIKIHENSYLKYLWAHDYSFFPLTYKDIGQLIDFLFGSGSYWELAPKISVIIILFMLFIGLIAYIIDLCVKKTPENVYKFSLIITPIGSMMLAGILNIYPFANRLVLSLLPLMIVIIVKPLDFSKKHLSALITSIWIIIVGYYLHFVYFQCSIFSDVLYFPESFFERDIYQYLKKKNESEKLIYIEMGAMMSGYVYNHMYHFSDNILGSQPSYPQITSFKNTNEFIEKLKNYNDFYYIYSSSINNPIDAPNQERRDYISNHYNCDDITSHKGKLFVLAKCVKK